MAASTQTSAAGRIQTPSSVGIQQALELAGQAAGAVCGSVSLDPGVLDGTSPAAWAFGLDTEGDDLACHATCRQHPDQHRRGTTARGRTWIGATILSAQRQPLGSLVLFGAPDLDERAVSRAASAIGCIADGQRGRERLTHQLRETEEERAALEEFTYAAAHDLMAPSRKLVALCKILHDDLGEDMPAQVSMDLDFVVDEAERMLKLTVDLLHIAKVGSQRLELESVDLGACARDAATALLAAVVENGVRLDIAEDLPEVAGNRVMLTQLLQNLLGNAIKFASPRDPLVVVSCDRSGPRPVIAVEDNGPGVPEALAQSIFDPFVRGPQPKASPGAHPSSTGLGLAIAARVVQRHRGRIWVESQPGRPTRFCFELGT